MFPRGEYAGIAPSGRPVISGGATGLEMLEIALANWPVLEPTKGGTPPDMQPELYKLYSPLPRSMQNTRLGNARDSPGQLACSGTDEGRDPTRHAARTL